MKQVVQAHRALAILRLLNGQPGRTSNDCVLGDCLKLLALTCGRDELRAELDKLERSGLIEIQRRSDLLVPTLTGRRTEAAEGTIVVEGVQLPAPDCPY
jgi:hypothetical protein